MKFLGLLLIFLVLSSPLSAQQLNYEIQGFGSQRVLVSIQGAVPLGMTSNMSSDGLSARISGVGVQFVPKDPKKTLPGAVSSVQQVKRGSTTDLVINLTTAADLTVSPGVSELRIFLKIKKGAALAADANNTPGANKLSPHPKARFPIRFLSAQQISGFGDNTLVAPGFTMVFPDVAAVKPLTSLSAILHLSAYTWDLLWAALSNTELQLVKKDAGGETTASDTEENQRLTTLVDELTRELVTLRQDLERSNQELAKLKSTSANGAQ